MNSFSVGRKSSIVVKIAAQLLSAILVLLAVSLPLFSQGAVGTILGGVFDSSGGAIAGAKVTIIDVARGTTRALTTDAAGEYTAPSLLVGTYTVRAEAKGFQTVEHTNVLLEVAQERSCRSYAVARRANPDRHGHRGSPGDRYHQRHPRRNHHQPSRLPHCPWSPVTSSNCSNCARASWTCREATGPPRPPMAGAREPTLCWSRVSLNSIWRPATSSSTEPKRAERVDELPLDSVQEFSTQQNPPAEYGWRDGSAVNLAVKSGTNSIHGSAYAFGRDAAATDAKQFSAIPGPKRSATRPWSSLASRWVARIIKDKLFWFVSAEFIRQSSFNPAGVVTARRMFPDWSASLQYGGRVHGRRCKSDRRGVNPLSAQIAGI